MNEFGLPPPTSVDIFPPPPETRLIAATKDNYSKQGVKDTLERAFCCDRFDDTGVG
jgi:hypothetical protein